MNNSKYEREYNVLSAAVIDAYETKFSRMNVSVMDKSRFDVVTENDLRIEEYIIEIIKREFPGDLILSEEKNPDTVVSNRTWTIDPIDGTFNMSRRSPLYGIQCALYLNGEIVFSIVYLPELNEFYSAQMNCGSYLNGSKIGVSKSDLEHSAVSFGDFPHTRPDDFNDEHKLMKRLSERIAKIRMFGSACIDFVYLASGRIDGTVLFTKNKWDIAPGILIAREAGAKIRSLEGEYSENSRVVIGAATDLLYECIVDCMKGDRLDSNKNQ